MHEVGRVAGGAMAAIARGGGRRGFAVGIAAGGAAGRPERAAAAAAPLGLLALQERGGEAASDQAAVRRADSLLAELQGLQADLLRGGADPARLARLAALGDAPDSVDPRLRDAVQGISLRARIELARRGWPEN